MAVNVELSFRLEVEPDELAILLDDDPDNEESKQLVIWKYIHAWLNHSPNRSHVSYLRSDAWEES